MNRIILAALLSAPLIALAAPEKCSIKAEPGKRRSDQVAMAKITATQAQATALDAAKADKRVSLKLEEDGCFVYAFVVANSAGEHTGVTVDPISGKVIRQAKVAAPEKKASAPREPSAAEIAPQAVQKATAEKPATSPAVPKTLPATPPKK